MVLFFRHHFYLSILQDLQDSRLRVNDKNLAVKLKALMAQSDVGDLEQETVTSALLSYAKWMPASLADAEMGISSPVMQRKGKRRKHHSGASDHETMSENEDLAVDQELGSHSTSSRLEHLLNADDSNITNSVMQNHHKLAGTKPSHAKYLFLQEVANLEDFGVEYFYVRLNNSAEDPYRIGVGPKGVTVTREESNELKYR